MMSPKQKIFITGGGIAGLTLSLFLDPNKFEITLFEKNSNTTEVGAAISVFPNALSVLKVAGILPEILLNAGEIRKSNLMTWDGKIIVKSHLKSEFPIICMHRKDLHSILSKYSKATIIKGKQVLDFENQIQNVNVKFSDGSQDWCDLLIGADGLHSIIRKQLIDDGEPIFHGSNVWRGIIQSNFELGYGSESWGVRKRFGIVPIREGYYGWWATIEENQKEGDEPNTHDKLKIAFKDWHDPIPDFISNTEDIIKNSLVDRKLVAGWSQGRVVLIGDAAHPTTPNLGQGGCMAMEGALTLSRCLDKYGISKEALEKYEALHFPRAKQIVNDSRRFGKLAGIKSLIGIAIRNTGFKLTPGSISQKIFDKYFNYRANDLLI